MNTNKFDALKELEEKSKPVENKDVTENKLKIHDFSKTINYIGFNQNNKWFVCVIGNQVKTFTLNPLKELSSYIFEEGEIKHVETLFTTNICAIIGGGSNPAFSSSKVIIWDMQCKKAIAELCFRKEVKGVKLKRDKIVITLDSVVNIYNLTDLKLVGNIDISPITDINSNNLVLLHPDANTNIIITPSINQGCVTVNSYDKDNNNKNYDINAHKGDISYIAVNDSATKIATSSYKGTIIRVFDCVTKKQLHEFRRGIDNVKINNLCFSSDSKYLAVSSTKGTIHIYSLVNVDGVTLNTLSFFSPITNVPVINTVVPDYCSSVWSYKQIRIPNLNEKEFKLSFGNTNDTLYILTYGGKLYSLDVNIDYSKENTKYDYKPFY